MFLNFNVLTVSTVTTVSTVLSIQSPNCLSVLIICYSYPIYLPNIVVTLTPVDFSVPIPSYGLTMLLLVLQILMIFLFPLTILLSLGHDVLLHFIQFGKFYYS